MGFQFWLKRSKWRRMPEKQRMRVSVHRFHFSFVLAFQKYFYSFSRSFFLFMFLFTEKAFFWVSTLLMAHRGYSFTGGVSNVTHVAIEKWSIAWPVVKGYKFIFHTFFESLLQRSSYETPKSLSELGGRRLERKGLYGRYAIMRQKKIKTWIRWWHFYT